MKRAGRIVLYLFGGILAVLLLITVIGVLLPKTHVAAVEGRYRARAADIHTAIVDVAAGPSWRTGVQDVTVLSQAAEPLRWRETADWGTITMVHEENTASRVVVRILDEGQGWGGKWTYEIVPDGDGTRVRITEDGVVTNPLYRFMSRFVMGYHTGLETYMRDLGKRFGESVEPVRVARSG